MNTFTFADIATAPPAAAAGQPTLPECPMCLRPFSKVGRQRFCSNKCRQKNFYHTYKFKCGTNYKLRQKPSERYKPGSRTRLVGGVTQRNGKFIAHISVGNVVRTKAYSIRKHGDRAAKLAAALQRMAWVIELGVWNPRDGDPFEMLSYADTFKRNHEYEDAVVDDVQSPWRHERGDD